MQNILMIGIDAGDIDYIENCVDKLPNIRRLFKGGLVTRLSSTASVMSASVWPSFYTGTLPGEHGHYFPMQWDPGNMILKRVSADWLYCEPFWYELVRNKIPITTLDVQVSFPSRIEGAFEVINWASQSFHSMHCNPPQLASEILRRFGKHPMGPDIPVYKNRATLYKIKRNLLTGVHLKGKLSRWLLKRTNWRLFITVFTECHRAGHYFWPETDINDSNAPDSALLDVYRSVDREIGLLVSEVDLSNTMIIVFSLHGMGPNTSQMHFVPQIMDRINTLFLTNELKIVKRSKRKLNLMRFLRERLPAKLQETVATSVPENIRDWVTSKQFGGGYDWSRTPGIALPSGAEGFVRCNLVDRESQGLLVQGSELHRRYLEYVRKEFLALRISGTNTPLVKNVIFPTEIFNGPRSQFLPDVAVLWQDNTPATEIYSDSLGHFGGQLATGRGGNHKPFGFAVLFGGIPKPVKARSIEDITDFSWFVRSFFEIDNQD